MEFKSLRDLRQAQDRDQWIRGHRDIVFEQAANFGKNTQIFKKEDVQSHQSTEKQDQGTKDSHSCKCDKAIVFYEVPKRLIQGGHKQEIHIFVSYFATPRIAQIADRRRKKANRASSGAIVTNKVANKAFIPSF